MKRCQHFTPDTWIEDELTFSHCENEVFEESNSYCKYHYCVVMGKTYVPEQPLKEWLET